MKNPRKPGHADTPEKAAAQSLRAHFRRSFHLKIKRGLRRRARAQEAERQTPTIFIKIKSRARNYNDFGCSFMTVD
ncbi:MAG: hypothetical protein KGZ61_09415 [Sandarakinorhabdus sp.]|nr:hypothetical protein [Sandarakinorhabdus sp.]